MVQERVDQWREVLESEQGSPPIAQAHLLEGRLESPKTQCQCMIECASQRFRLLTDPGSTEL